MKTKWGILGTANVADWGTIPGMLEAEGCEIYAIAGRNAEKVERYKERFGIKVGYVGYDKLLEDENVQVVYIPLPNHIHKEWVEKAILAGKNVLCEKPIGMNAAEVEEMYALAKEHGVVLMEAYAYLHSPYIKALKKIVSSGELGDIKYIETAFLTQGYADDIRNKKEYGGGAMYDLGCYCTTMILSLIDANVVDAKGIAEFSDGGVDTNTAGLMRFDNGTTASFNVGMNLGIDKVDGYARFDRLFIHGTKGKVFSDVEYNQAGELEFTVETNGVRRTEKVSVGNNYKLEVEQMNRVTNEGEDAYITPEFSVKNAKVIDMILNSMGY
ncbi:Gfo/Idh/MocA family protein [Eubacterium xylanophilum]|uniref:Gfo/Idh/MocA family protein n=1 Tax=Eubacterium xylanophilum TaxID=39497 RepID=UPI0004791006|nr:Gfo/Idh/MocA family oxidoreductase [Eubacterium xylanophilum]